MRFCYILIAIVLFSSCNQQQSSAPIEIISYPYNNQMMDNTIKKGKSYGVIEQDNYNLNEIIIFDYQDNVQGVKRPGLLTVLQVFQVILFRSNKEKFM